MGPASPGLCELGPECKQRQETPPDAIYTFKHALIQDAAYNSLLISRRQQYHKQTAITLSENFTDTADAEPELLAYHYFEAGLTQEAVSYWLQAGEQSLSRYAWQEALAHFLRGLSAKDVEPGASEPAQDSESAALLFGLGRAQAATFERHQLGEAFNTLSRAFEHYVDQGNVAQAVAAAIFPIAPAGVQIPGLAQLMARALILVPGDSHDAGRLLSRYGGILGAAEGDYEGAQQALNSALTIARREGDRPLELQTLTNAADVSGRNLNWQESMENGVRAIELLTGAENPYFEVLSRYFTALSFIHLGDPEGSLPHALALRDLTERRTTGVLASLCYGPIIHISCLQGDWDAGR